MFFLTLFFLKFFLLTMLDESTSPLAIDSVNCHSIRWPLDGGAVPESYPNNIVFNGDVCRGNSNHLKPVQQKCKDKIYG